MSHSLINICYDGYSGQSHISSLEAGGMLYISLKDISAALNNENRALNERHVSRSYITIVRGVLEQVDDDEYLSIPSNESHKPEEIYLTQPGLFRILSHDKTEAGKKFQRWLYHEAIPSIMKYGEYPPPSYKKSSSNSHDIRVAELLLTQAEDLHKQMEAHRELAVVVNDNKQQVIELKSRVEMLESSQRPHYSVAQYIKENRLPVDEKDVLNIEAWARKIAAESNEEGLLINRTVEGEKVMAFPDWVILQAIENNKPR